MTQQQETSSRVPPEIQEEGVSSPVSPHTQRFSARVENVGDIRSLDYAYYGFEPVSPLGSPNFRGRESMVSLPSRASVGSPELGRSSSGRWSRSRSRSRSLGSGYQQVDGQGSQSPPASGRLDRKTSAKKMAARRCSVRDSDAVETIPEAKESPDMGLLDAAAPIDGSEVPMRPPEGPALPATPGDQETRKRQAQEQAGILTGGLGAGVDIETTQIREMELTSPASPTAMRLPARSLSFSRRKSLSRSATRKALGQSEADRLGQAVQVIIEEPPEAADQTCDLRQENGRDSKMDLSFVAGDAMPRDNEELRSYPKTRAAPIPTMQRIETFYPRPDWRPFSMRWPYLAMLIVLSLALVGCTEALYQHSATTALVTFTNPSDLEGITYFSIKFLPTLAAVTYGVLWQMTDSDVKRLEPYHQLSREGGATAAETLNVDYITSFSFLRPLYAYQLRHYAVTVSSVASVLAVSAVPTLCSASIVLLPDREQRAQNPLGEKSIQVHPVYARLLEAVLVVVALLGCGLFHQLNSRRSGLLADVKGIGGLAAMANRSHILMDFKDMDVATHKDIHHKLANRRYHLVNSSLAPLDTAATRQEQHGSTTPTSPPEMATAPYHLSLNPHPLMLRARGCVPLIAGIVLFAILFPVSLLTPLGDVTDRAPWLATALAVCIKLAWGAVDTTVRLMEPYYILYRRHAPPRTLTLDYTALPFAWAAVRALLNGHWLVAAVGLGTVATELLTVLVASLATVPGGAFAGAGDPSGEETVASSRVSLAAATAILGYMAAVAAAAFARRRRPFLPRQPTTVASALAFVHQSKMLYDFVGAERLPPAEVVRRLAAARRSYGLGWFEGRDGRVHCGVDQEELVAAYRHGVDYSRSNMPWVEEFTEWL